MKIFATILFLLLAIPGVRGGCAYLKNSDRSPLAAVGIFLPVVCATGFALVLLYCNLFY